MKPLPSTVAVTAAVVAALAAPTTVNAATSPASAATSPAASAVAGVSAPAAAPARGKLAPGTMARKYLGTPRSGLPWHSGAFTGEYMNVANATKWGTWRGRPSDAVPTYPESPNWVTMRRSEWHIATYNGFKGTLVYGLPILPKNGKPSDLKAIARGAQDPTYRTIAKQLRTRYKSGKVVVRIGWEANGSWMSFRATYGTAADYRAAFRRVAKVVKKEFPQAVIDFDINCGTKLPGQRNRLDSLTRLYPGDDVVDLIGCDTFDWDVLKATNDRQWRAALKPRTSVGIQDVADFAHARGKGLSYPEWGLTHAYDGNGDNPYYIRKMFQFFQANSDILVLEDYFNVPDRSMSNSLWNVKPQNPKAGAEYRRLW